MTKFSVTKDGIPLDPSLYTWDENTKTFSTDENRLVLDFTGITGVTFNTGYSCTFKTGHACTFNTGHSCVFNTGSDCTFKTNNYCTFDTGPRCTFKTEDDCVFKTGYHCTFKTSSDCTFDTGSDCTFKTSSACTFITSSDCTFEVGDNCFVRRYDVKGFKGVTEIPTGKKIKLNEHGIAGYTIIEEKKEIKIDGKKYQLTEVKE
jgi:hypothetical protein